MLVKRIVTMSRSRKERKSPCWLGGSDKLQSFGRPIMEAAIAGNPKHIKTIFPNLQYSSTPTFQYFCWTQEYMFGNDSSHIYGPFLFKQILQQLKYRCQQNGAIIMHNITNPSPIFSRLFIYLRDLMRLNSSIITQSPIIGERNIPLLRRHTAKLRNIAECHLFPPSNRIRMALDEKKQNSDSVQSTLQKMHAGLKMKIILPHLANL